MRLHILCDETDNVGVCALSSGGSGGFYKFPLLSRGCLKLIKDIIMIVLNVILIVCILLWIKADNEK